VAVVVAESSEHLLPRVHIVKGAEKAVRKSHEDSRASYSDALAIFINFLSGIAFTVAAALTSRFLLMMAFWQGILVGGVLYIVFIIIGGACEGV
jgi:hypothetical protein